MLENHQKPENSSNCNSFQEISSGSQDTVRGSLARASSLEKKNVENRGKLILD
jgi:hypothetical protein